MDSDTTVVLWILIGCLVFSVGLTLATPWLEAQRVVLETERIQACTSKCVASHPSWSTRDCTRVCERTIWIRMTAEQARASRGNPRDINRSGGSWGIHEQWVYGSYYLYFENGRLTSWQN